VLISTSSIAARAGRKVVSFDSLNEGTPALMSPAFKVALLTQRGGRREKKCVQKRGRGFSKRGSEGKRGQGRGKE